MNFCDFRFIVLCDGLFDAGFTTKKEAHEYAEAMRKKYPGYAFTVFVVDDGDERELERIWCSYQSQQEEEWDR